MSKLSSWVDKNITHSSDRKREMQAVNEQINLYKQQQQQLHDENERVAKQKDAERVRLHEKQIRSLRRTFRTPGFLEHPQVAQDSAPTMG